MKKISIIGLTALLAACSSGTYTTDVSSDTYREDYKTAKIEQPVMAEAKEVAVTEAAPRLQEVKQEAPEMQVVKAQRKEQQVTTASTVQAKAKPVPEKKRVVKLTPTAKVKKVKIIPPTKKQMARSQRFGYTLQVIALDSPYKSRTYADQLPAGTPVWEHFKRVNGTDWYAILYGDYATKSEAKAAIKTLPDFFRLKKPFVKSLDKIKNSAYPKLNKLR